MKKYRFRFNGFYDGEEIDVAAKAAAEKAATEAKAAAEKAAAEAANKRAYSQDEVDKIVENEKKARREETSKLILELENLKKSKNLTEAERGSLQDKIEDLSKTLLTKEELARQEREKLEKEKKQEVGQLTQERDTWKSRFENSLIEREITDAASKAGAHHPQTFIKLLRSDTFTEEVVGTDGKPTGRFAVKSKTTKKEGDQYKDLVMTPDELVKYMKEQPDTWGFLFKGEKQGGLGGGNAQKPIQDIDPKSVTPENYARVREQLLGKKPS